MSAVHLPSNFALQSNDRDAPFVAIAHRHAGGVALLLQGSRYPLEGCVRIDGLSPGRHYVVQGATHRFVRTDPQGIASVDVHVAAPTLVTVTSVI